MNERNFCYWLKGFFEMNSNTLYLTREQTYMIQEHLKLVFNQKTQTYQLQDLYTDKIPVPSAHLTC